VTKVPLDRGTLCPGLRYSPRHSKFEGQRDSSTLIIKEQRPGPELASRLSMNHLPTPWMPPRSFGLRCPEGFAVAVAAKASMMSMTPKTAIQVVAFRVNT
jgi:hypothetical protein